LPFGAVDYRTDQRGDSVARFVHWERKPQGLKFWEYSTVT
jgi:hypothetical protein